MKKINIFILACVALLSFNSCLVDDENREEFLGNPTKLSGFAAEEETFVFIPSDVEIVSSRVFVERKTAQGTGNLPQETFEYTLSQNHPSLTILNDSNVLTINNNGYVSNPIDYSIDPNLINVGENVVVTVSITPTSGNVGVENNKEYDIIIQKCDPPLAGNYTVAGGNFGGDGEIVTITANDCSGNYTASNLAPFNGTFSWMFNHNDTNNTVDIFGTLAAFPNTVSGNGTVQTNGTIQFTGVGVSGTNLQGYNFNLIPN